MTFWNRKLPPFHNAALLPLAVASLLISVAGCATAPPAATTPKGQTVGYPQPELTGGIPATAGRPRQAASLPAPPASQPGVDIATTSSAFHDAMAHPSDWKTHDLLASTAVEDDMALNPDGSFRLPPPVHIPIIDISQTNHALAGTDTPDDVQPVDISVPW